MKIPISNSLETRQLFEKEIIEHHNLAGGENKHENLLELKGAFRMPGGAPAIVMEMAPNGDINDMGVGLKLLEGDGPGKIPPELAKVISLTLLSDMSKGLESLHDRGFAHNDLKDVNAVVGKDGRAILIDFGETKVTGDSHVKSMANENASYASPELLFQKRRIDGEVKAIDTLMKRYEASITGTIGTFPVGEGSITNFVDELSSALNSYKNELKEEIALKHDRGVDVKNNDLWGLGTAALKLFSGQVVADAGGKSDNFEVMDFGYAVKSSRQHGDTPAITNRGRSRPSKMGNSLCGRTITRSTI